MYCDKPVLVETLIHFANAKEVTLQTKGFSHLLQNVLDNGLLSFCCETISGGSGTGKAMELVSS